MTRRTHIRVAVEPGVTKACSNPVAERPHHCIFLARTGCLDTVYALTHVGGVVSTDLRELRIAVRAGGAAGRRNPRPCSVTGRGITQLDVERSICERVHRRGVRTTALCGGVLTL